MEVSVPGTRGSVGHTAGFILMGLDIIAQNYITQLIRAARKHENRSLAETLATAML